MKAVDGYFEPRNTIVVREKPPPVGHGALWGLFTAIGCAIGLLVGFLVAGGASSTVPTATSSRSSEASTASSGSDPAYLLLVTMAADVSSALHPTATATPTRVPPPTPTVPTTPAFDYCRTNGHLTPIAEPGKACLVPAHDPPTTPTPYPDCAALWPTPTSWNDVCRWPDATPVAVGETDVIIVLRGAFP